MAEPLASNPQSSRPPTNGPGTDGAGEHPYMKLVRDEPWPASPQAPADDTDVDDDAAPPHPPGEQVLPEPGFTASRSWTIGIERLGARHAADPMPAKVLHGAGMSVDALRAELSRLAAENEALRAEVHHLRRRDETVNYTMNRIDEELRLAAKLQRDFMPRSLPVLGRVRFHALFRPAGYVSGDLYDVTRLDEHHVGFYMADAVGHGMPAALLTMFMRQALQTREVSRNWYRLLRPSESLERLNAVMVEQELSDTTFATAVCGLINAETGSLLVSSAGHPRPVLIPAAGPPTELETDGSLLGVFQDEKYTDVSLTLQPGDRLVVFSDGVEVAFPRSDAGRDEGELSYDATRWLDELLTRRSESAEAMLLGLSEAMDRQAGSLSPADDLTVILVEMLGAPPEPPST
ncbi:MAG: PP2C family protein-serine/threonine phosphatase [Tepidisphaerales bacterium]